MAECEELFTKFSGDYERYKTSLIVAKEIALKALGSMREWNVKADPLFNYYKFYEIRDILMVGKTTHFDDDSSLSEDKD